MRLSEIAAVRDGPGEPTQYLFFGDRRGARLPAVTVEVAKRPGVNATVLAHRVHARVEELRPTLLSRDVAVVTTRDYGKTAKHKSDDLMFHLLLATLSVVLLIALALGRREALIVAIAIPVTLALTLFLYRFLGYTLNRVSRFFSGKIFVEHVRFMVETHGYPLEADHPLVFELGHIMRIPRDEEDTVESYCAKVRTKMKVGGSEKRGPIR